MKKPTIDPEFERLVPPLTTAERNALEASLIAEGRALDPIKVWRGLIVDGHNRFCICEALGLPYEVDRLKFKNRGEVKAWMLKHQAARRSLTRDQLLVLHLMHGQDPPPGSTAGEAAVAEEAIAKGLGPDLISGRLTVRQARNRLKPKPPRGPTKYIPAGHETSGLSTLTGPDGEVKATWIKTRVAGADEPEWDPREHSHLLKKVAIQQRGDGTIAVQWNSWAADERLREDAMREAWARHASFYAGLIAAVPGPLVRLLDKDMITLYPLGDPHIGMLSWAPETGDHFDVAIAVRELLECVRQLVEGAASTYECIITNLGDFMHAQDDSNKTPGHGNQLDVDGRHARVLDAGHAVLRGIVDLALTKHHIVRVRNLPGNHDPRVSAELAMWLRAVYENEPRVIVEDAYAAHQYDVFGKNLFGWHHGDRTPGKELLAIMAVDMAKEWGETLFRVWHCGHVHHKSADKEHPGGVVETHRTMAGRDAWHAARYRAGRSLTAITYHKEFGEDGRKTVGLARVRAALNRE
jgi:hypothetical protein